MRKNSCILKQVQKSFGPVMKVEGMYAHRLSEVNWMSVAKSDMIMHDALIMSDDTYTASHRSVHI
ncbi:hypothetical protein AU255_02465 [Methyloprofundus sedimenti]|uniref:Uncharacterized protein n=1 Tax=Methyloprofundus sedimenti TaxID=1420851 RepID=A0A1V8M5E6_9GAMM|nr:hypothetical protein AU255_02465 [Methyloprofundus sedimenti]